LVDTWKAQAKKKSHLYKPRKLNSYNEYQSLYQRIGNCLIASGKAEYKARYDELVRLFGQPIKYENEENLTYSKTSTEWIFLFDNITVNRNAIGTSMTCPLIIHIHDYKRTSLYSSQYPSPAQFRANNQNTIWEIGSNGDFDLVYETLYNWKGIKVKRNYL
jgi:hypothetical protein